MGSAVAVDHRGAQAGLRAALADLATEVDRVKQSRGFQAYLEAMARFWHYSPTNQWLIARARSDATRVAGRRTWEKLGRTVRRGATPIHILAPTRGGFPFIAVEVFDLSQTRGRPLPALDLELRGRTRWADRLERAAGRLGIEVRPLVGRGRAVGLSTGGTILIRDGLAPRERAATLAHELAHELLHTHEQARKRPRPWSEAERETEAEATAYAVLRALGLPSTAPAYIAWRGGSGELIVRSLQRIQRATRAILEAAGVRR